ncbi:MAG: hypothetical protein SCARUB_02461 [Candidatus Scalindua rubra]|uniref:Uncharacterized protein n=1 Tax=Candidatus Scalindua rubra TaxID=1872076 RepID=A0A1E3XBR1_9BACT|nr:MAG: hypothetical protein SCARUB_02461 [Candidatus Scalindua rubra]
MSKCKESNGHPEKGVHLNSTERDGLDKTSESLPENELFQDFDEGRRGFLKKLIISAAYVTPVILSFSIGEAEARRRPTRRRRRRKRKRR